MEIEKNNAKYRQIDRKCEAAVKCLSSQNGRIKFYSVWAILLRFNKMHTKVFAQATNKCLKCDILKTMREKSTLVKFQVFDVFKSTRQVYYQLNFNWI